MPFMSRSRKFWKVWSRSRIFYLRLRNPDISRGTFPKNLPSLLLCAGPALAGAGPNARPSRGTPLTSGVITSSWSVNRDMAFLMKIF